MESPLVSPEQKQARMDLAASGASDSPQGMLSAALGVSTGLTPGASMVTDRIGAHAESSQPRPTPSGPSAVGACPDMAAYGQSYPEQQQPHNPMAAFAEQVADAVGRKLDRRISDVESRIANLDRNISDKFNTIDAESQLHGSSINTHSQLITELQTQNASLLEKVTSLESGATRRSASATVKGNNPRAHEAFLGGFPKLERETLRQRAADVIGTPPGFVRISAPGDVANHAFVEFRCPEDMRTFVREKRNELPNGLRIKPNRDADQRARGRNMFDVRQKLVAAGLPMECIRTVRNEIFKVDANGEAQLVGTLVGQEVQWETAAPPAVRVTS